MYRIRSPLVALLVCPHEFTNAALFLAKAAKRQLVRRGSAATPALMPARLFTGTAIDVLIDFCLVINYPLAKENCQAQISAT